MSMLFGVIINGYVTYSTSKDTGILQ